MATYTPLLLSLSLSHFNKRVLCVEMAHTADIIWSLRGLPFINYTHFLEIKMHVRRYGAMTQKI